MTDPYSDALNNLNMSLQRPRHLTFATAVTIVLLVAAPGAPPVSAAAPPAVAAQLQPALSIATAAVSHPHREVFGFALASSLADPTIGYPSWNFDLLTTVAFFGLHVNSNGQLANDSGYATWSSSSLTNLVSLAHQHGAKVVLTVILQDFSPNTPAMCAGLANADTTVTQTVQQVKARGVDGVNIDYEGLDGSCGHTDTYWAQHAMTAFAQKMRAGLGSSYYLSVDTYASSAADGYGFFDVVGLSRYVDSFFVMAYDLEYSNYARPPAGCSRFCLGPTGPLSGYYYNDTSVLSQYTHAVGAAKVILGVPYYGRKACVGAVVANAYPTSSIVADSYLDAAGEAAYYEVRAGTYAVHRDSHSAGGERWDTWYNTTLGCTRELYWDDATSLGKKYDLVNAGNVRGVGVWNLNYGGGAPELWAALRTHFVGCTGVALTAAPASPQFTQTRVTFTASASGCTNAQYRFWVQSPGTGWSIVRDYSTSPTYAWTGTAIAGSYRVEVDARANTSGNYDTYAIVADTLRTCTALSLSPSRISPQPPGTAITLTATATCPATPEYRFLVKAPGGSWGVVQGYGVANTFAWSTAGKPQGTYGLEVDVRDYASPASYDRYAILSYRLYAAPCTSPSLTALPASPAGTGAQVTLTATTTACPNPTYRFWVQPPGGSWQVVRQYAASNTFTWTGTGNAGTYHLEVNVRDQSSTRSYEAYRDITYQVNPCASAALALSKPSPEPSGTVVALSGRASCAGTAQYRFLLKPPGGAWKVVQAYGSATSYSWDTTGLADGVYGLEVDVRNQGSSASYEAWSSTSFLVNACSAARLTADHSSPQVAGTRIVLTGGAACMGTPVYRFLVRSPSGTWVVVQGYSTAAAYTWNTTGLAKGTYGLEVDVRNQGSADGYETWAQLTFAVG